MWFISRWRNYIIFIEFSIYEGYFFNNDHTFINTKDKEADRPAHHSRRQVPHDILCHHWLQSLSCGWATGNIIWLLQLMLRQRFCHWGEILIMIFLIMRDISDNEGRNFLKNIVTGDVYMTILKLKNNLSIGCTHLLQTSSNRHCPKWKHWLLFFVTKKMYCC